MPHDILRLLRTNCSSCGETIPSTELVIKVNGNVYHINCFVCVVCQCRLQKGQYFALKNNELYCTEHFEQTGNKVDNKQYNNSSYSDTDSDTKQMAKRSRTILTNEQLSLFKSSFEISSKPCRKVREELSQETGLSARVVQVWFQNQRAKVKKLSRRDRYDLSNVASYRMANRQLMGRKSRGEEDFAKHGYNNPLIMGQPGTFSLPLASHYTTFNPVVLPRQYPMQTCPSQPINGALTYSPTMPPQPGAFLDMISQLTDGIPGKDMSRQRYIQHSPSR